MFIQKKRSLYTSTATFSGAPDWIRTSGLPGRSSQTHNVKQRFQAVFCRLCTNKKTYIKSPRSLFRIGFVGFCVCGGQIVVTVVNFAGKRGTRQGAKWSTRGTLFRLGEPAPGKGIRRFLLPGQETKVQAFALRRRAQIQPAALAVGRRLHLQ